MPFRWAALRGRYYVHLVQMHGPFPNLVRVGAPLFARLSPGPIPGGKACPDSTTKCSHKDSHQLAHLRIRQCNSWCRDPPDRTTNDSHEGHQLVLQTELIDLHATKQPQGQLDTPTERSEMHLLAHFVA